MDQKTLLLKQDLNLLETVIEQLSRPDINDEEINYLMKKLIEMAVNRLVTKPCLF